MNDFLDVSVLLPTILKLETDSSEYENLPTTIKKLEPPQIFPIISNPEEIDEIYKNSKNIIQAISDTDFGFKFSIEIVSTLCSFFGPSINSAPNYTVILALNSFFALLKSGTNIEHVPIILELLKMIALYPVAQKYRYYAASAFAAMYNFEELNFMPDDLQPYLQPFRSFFTDVSDLPSSSFKLLVTMADLLSKQANVKLFGLYLKNLEPIIGKCHEKISNDLIAAIIKYINKSPFLMSESTMKVVSKMAKFYNAILLLDYINLLSENIFNEITKNAPISKFIPPKDKTEEIKTGLKSGMISKLSVSDGTTFEGEVNIKIMKPIIPAYDSIDCMINPDIKKLLDNISDILSLNQIFKTNFIENSFFILGEMREDDEYMIDKIAAMVYLYLKHEDVFANSKSSYILFNTFIFDSRITFYDSDENFLGISTLRNEILYLLSLIDIKIIHDLFKELFELPILTSEVFLRFSLQDRITFPKIKYEPEVLPNIISLCLQNYRLSSDSENRINICQARISALYFLDRIFQNVDVQNAFMHCDHFINELTLMTFENPTRKVALDFFINFMLSTEGRAKTMCVNSLISQFSLLFLIPITSEKVNCAIDFVEFLTKITTKVPSYIKDFDEIIGYICNRLSDIEQVDGAREYFFGVINLMRSISNHRLTTQREFIQIETGAKRIFGQNLNYPLFRALLELTAGKTIENMRLQFEVAQPKGISSLIRIFAENHLIINVLNVINQLCEFSEENTYNFHNYEIDLCIIDFIQKTKDEEALLLSLDILQTILSCSSSATVANRFVSLFCPIKEEYLPSYHKVVLDFFNNIISNASLLPECGYPVGPKNFATFGGLPSKLLDSSTTIIWLFSTQKEGSTTLLTMEDDSGTSLSLVIVDGKLTTIINFQDKSWKGPSQFDVPLNQWFKLSMMALSGGEEANYFNVFLWCNSELYQRQVYPFIPVKPGKMRVHLCNQNEETEGTFIGPFGIFRYLTEEEVNIAFDTNPHSVPLDLEPYVYIIPQKDGDMIALRSYPQKSIKYTMPKNPKPFSFIDIVSSRIGYSILTPLYAELDFKFENGEKFPKYAIKITQLLRNAFALNPRGQSEFYNNKGFTTISYLIQSASSEHLTYELYNSFACLASTLTDSLLIEDLLTNILENFALWKDSTEIDKITRHWAYSLFPCTTKISSGILPFDKLIRIIRAYFYYKPIEAGIAIELKNRAEIEGNISKIRKNLMIAAYIVAKLTPQQEIYEVLSRNIITSGEVEQQIELLTLLLEILSIPGNVFPKSNTTTPVYTPLLILHNLIGTKNAKIIYLTIEVIIKMHETFNITELSLDEHFQIIYNQLPSSAITEELFELVFDSIKTKPILFSFLCYLAYNLGEKAENRVFQCCEPSESLTKTKYWTVWLAMIFVHSSPATRFSIIKFVIALGCKTWMPFMNAVDFIGMSADPMIFKSENDFISEAGVSILQHPDSITEEEAVAFLDLIRNFVFLKPYGYLSDSIKGVKSSMISSVETTEQHEEENLVKTDNKSRQNLKQSIHNITSNGNASTSGGGAIVVPFSLTIQNANNDEAVSKATNLLASLRNTKIKRHFGIRLDGIGEWEDSVIVEIALAIYEKKAIQKHLSTIVLICAFLSENQIVAARALSFISQDVIERECTPEVCILKEKMYKKDITKATAATINENYIDALEQYEKFSCNDSRSIFAKEYFDFLKQASEKENIIISLTTKKLIETVLHNTNVLQESFSNAYFTTRNVWRKVWRSMTLEGFPWSQSITVGDENDENATHVLVKKRDQTFCSYCIPMNIRRYYGQIKRHIVNIKSQNPIADFVDEIDDSFNDSKLKQVFPISESVECEYIGICASEKGYICISTDSIRLLKGNHEKKLAFETIANIYVKTWLGKPTALEIVQNNGCSYFINMKNGENSKLLLALRDSPFKKLNAINQLTTMSMSKRFKDTKYTKKWVEGKISTFEYLNAINMYSGRTFNSLMQYPIFPWIFADYSSEKLDLDNPATYRNLAKPIGSIDPQRLSELITRAKSRKEFWLYDSTFSTPSGVSSLLSNIEPFASLTPERVSSLQKEYKKALTALGNYTELTPEFFFSPEVVENMELPKWAKSPFHFIYMHRKALESDYVSKFIHKWIDIIWGKAQSGSLSCSSMNLFDPQLYPSNPNINAKLLTSCGQIPIQLFKDFHPKRAVNNVEPLDINGKVRVSTSNTIIGAAIFKYADYQTNILTIDNEGRMTAHKINREIIDKIVKTKQNVDLTGEDSDFLIFSKKIPNFKTIHKESNEKLSHISPLSSGSFVIISNDEDDAYYIHPASNVATKLQTNDVFVTCCACNDNIIAAADCESMVYVFKEDDMNHPLMTSQVCSAQIKCITVSSKFHNVACGTKENSIFLISMSSKTISRIINLDNCHATNILITPAWGFVVAFTKGFDDTNKSKTVYRICIISCNGDIIGSQTIKNEPVAFSQYTDRKGFDHVIYADKDRCLYEFEAYYPEKRRLVTNERLDVMNIEVWQKMGIFVVITTDSIVHFYPII